MKKILSLMVTLCMIITCMAVPMVVSADGETNYALASNGATITATNTSDPANIIDGNTGTSGYFRKPTDTTDTTITLELANFVELGSVNIRANSTNYQLYSLEGSLDGNEWFDLALKVTVPTTGCLTYHFEETPINAKFIKIENIGTSNIIFYELEVYGTEVTGFPYLKSLTSASGTWTTAFDQSTTSYKVQVESLDSLPTLTYEALMSDATINYVEASVDNNYTATIAVTHGGETTNYTVQFFVLYNWALPGNGATITSTRASGDTLPAFDGDLNTYGYFTPGQYIQVEFDDFVDVSEVVLYTNNSNVSMSYSFDGTVWHDMTPTANDSIGGNKYLKKFAVSGGVAKYVKAVANTNCIPYEFEVYGTKVTGSPYLKNLASASGTWTTAFDQSTTSYKVQVESLDSLPALTYEKLMEDAEVVYTEASVDNNYTATIAVTHGGETTNYTVQFVLFNWALPVNGATITSTRALEGNEGTLKAFDGDLNSYSYFTPGQYIQVEFDDFVNVSEVAYYSNDSSVSMYYSLDGTVWYDMTPTADDSIGGNKYLKKFAVSGGVAKYVKAVANTSCIPYEFEVYGRKLTASDMPCVATTANYDAETFTATATANLVNVGTSEVSDKYYLFAVYVDGVFYGVDKIDKSSEKISAGNVGTSAVLDVVLPEGTEASRVTGKLFVWSDSVTIVPVTTPFDVL